jgi:hypothetical protein
MNEIYIKATPPASNNWNRPSGWLTLPTITSADTRIVGLVAVYENEENAISIAAISGTSQNYNIDWGDATSQTGTINNTYTKRYNYASISSIILQDEFGYNYKQVIVTITNNSGAVTIWNLGAPITQGGSNNWLDISYSWAANLQFGVRYPSYLQRLQIFKATITGNVNNNLDNLSSLRFLRWENVNTSAVTSAQSYCNFLGNIDKIDFSFTPAVTCAQFFYLSRMRAMGNLNFSGTTISTNMFGYSSVEEIGNVDITSTQNATNMFLNCQVLEKLGTLTTPALTNMTTMFNACFKLKEIVFTTCSAVTTTTSSFTNCLSLRKLRMPGISVTFSIGNCNMQRLELIDLFNDLAITSAKTITITNNPGVADLTAADLLIATSKGWTVTT